MTDVQERSQTDPGPERRPGELGARELARWLWRQLTSMRTALILLLLLRLLINLLDSLFLYQHCRHYQQ